MRDDTKNGCVADYMSPRTAFFFQQLMKSSRVVMKFDLYGTLMINRRNRVLIVFHLYSCSKHKLSMILMAKIML